MAEGVFYPPDTGAADGADAVVVHPFAGGDHAGVVGLAGANPSDEGVAHGDQSAAAGLGEVCRDFDEGFVWLEVFPPKAKDFLGADAREAADGKGEPPLVGSSGEQGGKFLRRVDGDGLAVFALFLRSLGSGEAFGQVPVVFGEAEKADDFAADVVVTTGADGELAEVGGDGLGGDVGKALAFVGAGEGGQIGGKGVYVVRGKACFALAGEVLFEEGVKVRGFSPRGTPGGELGEEVGGGFVIGSLAFAEGFELGFGLGGGTVEGFGGAKDALSRAVGVPFPASVGGEPQVGGEVADFDGVIFHLRRAWVCGCLTSEAINTRDETFIYLPVRPWKFASRLFLSSGCPRPLFCSQQTLGPRATSHARRR